MRVAVVAAVRVPVPSEPLVARAPLQSPEAVQVAALLVVQASVALPPDVTVEGVAEIAIVGAGGAATLTVADCVTLPPPPVHVSV